ncbi:uncharacterized protein GLRG_09436 [Colletotrichum graminicola M1.001]|uniref:Tat pathway signal sequence n=1 Tax=Colletotrichum graminicola (strain M1.001 / M2 / FGSC 10212) TaxID=645133 RepID=E3QTL7_COLGM|nr:uncharacterized protein GLRG_09436 [Colletotrichum graminicola M1.001]EFQ34292.1 hypothetical protein GLRG_09436 [Colletotrichum graminicola M1.001]
MFVVAILRTPSSQPQPSLYWEEPVRSEILLKNKPRTFTLDVDYAMPPSETVNEAWSSLLPKQGGFFKHPTISPSESCFAVFHQIHCLDMLRLALYELHPDTRNSSHHAGHGSHKYHSTAAEANASNDIYHVGHCFDLLRQTIMCRPDLTAEPINPALGGVTGFGTERQCIDWRELMDWMAANE